MTSLQTSFLLLSGHFKYKNRVFPYFFPRRFIERVLPLSAVLKRSESVWHQRRSGLAKDGQRNAATSNICRPLDSCITWPELERSSDAAPESNTEHVITQERVLAQPALTKMSNLPPFLSVSL